MHYFYRETTVKKPQKQYQCSLCGELILGEHIYVATSYGDFYTYRAHEDCHDILRELIADQGEVDDIFLTFREAVQNTNCGVECECGEHLPIPMILAHRTKAHPEINLNLCASCFDYELHPEKYAKRRRRPMLSFKITYGNTTYIYPSTNGDFIRVMVKTHAGTKVFDVEASEFALMHIYTDISHGGSLLRCQGYDSIHDMPGWGVGV